jgi:hypothetical protein
MRRDTSRSAGSNEVRSVVPGIGAKRASSPARQIAIEHRQRRAALGEA